MFKLSAFRLVYIMLLLTLASQVDAVAVPRPLGNEHRIKIINYMPNTVIRFIGHYSYHSIIEFGSDEEVKTISMGTPNAWQMYPEGNRIFLKPIEENATTNMTVITNKRMYFFEMHAEFADGVSDPSISFITKFMYPDAMTVGAATTLQTMAAPDLTKPDQYNLRYKVSGKSRRIEPILVFDDGEFTYFKFRDVNAELPAIFSVDAQNNEGLVNYRIFAGYVVVERVTDRFTLRHGFDTICIFNEAFDANTSSNFPSNSTK